MVRIAHFNDKCEIGGSTSWSFGQHLSVSVTLQSLIKVMPKNAQSFCCCCRRLLEIRLIEFSVHRLNFDETSLVANWAKQC